MKKILFPVLLVMSSLILVGCGKQTNPDVSPEGTPLVYTSYVNKAEKFTLLFPQTWAFKENVYGSAIMFFTPQTTGDEARENFGITVQTLATTGDTLETKYLAVKEKLQSSMQDLSVISEEDVQINTIPAKTITYTSKSSDFTIQRKQTFFVKDGKIYIFTYTALKESFDDYEAIINKMIGSFVLE